MEKNVKISILNEFYGNLLTQKQYDFINDYYNNDLSLSEIAENNNITRQAVNDCLEKSRNLLEKYESVVGKIELKNKLKQNLSELGQKYQMDNLTKDINKIIGNID